MRVPVLSFLFLSLATVPVISQEPFGKVGGQAVTQYTLKNPGGMIVKLMDYGATVTSIRVPDKAGKVDDVVLGFDKADDYATDANQFFGCTTGRVANRIAKGKFTIDGKEYQVALNNGPNHLHGGVKKSLDKILWHAKPDLEHNEVTFTYTSPDGEEGYPGNLEITVIFRLTHDNALVIRYAAKTDKATPVNLTNHSYFNLAGAGAKTVLDHEIMIAADGYTPTDDTLIPTGKIEPVAGTPFDFTKMKRIGTDFDFLVNAAKSAALGYDHNFVLRKREAGNVEQTAAIVREPSSGRVMKVLTDQPGVQFYTGNFLKGQTGRDGKTYAKQSALCLETQAFPNAVNTPGFPNVILRPGETYRHTCIYAFAVEK
jgi:aldose 1-epimerase